MHRSAIVVLLLALMISVPLLGQHVLELEELHLASWENIPGAGPDATGPVSGAIVIAWHAEHGYARLLPDLNGDGRVDREDTIELGARFLEPMRAFEGPVSDPMLVDVLAHYVAGRYPDTFELLIYDSSFPEEYRQVLGRPFGRDVVPGIELVLQDEPTHETYVRHLEEGRPGIVGIGFEREANLFSVSRSAVLAGEPRGWPVDLVNTAHDAFGPANVWETFLRLEGERWHVEVDDLIPFEVFIVLVPVREPDAEPQPGDDPDDPSDPGDDPFDPGDPDPDPALLPNLWVTNMTGCWSWSNDSREHVVATVTGVVHNGGQASASGVQARITAGGRSTTVPVGTIAAGGQKIVTATIDVGSIDVVGWPVSTSITADPSNAIAEADESNNTTDSAFPQSSDCL